MIVYPYRGLGIGIRIGMDHSPRIGKKNKQPYISVSVELFQTNDKPYQNYVSSLYIFKLLKQNERKINMCYMHYAA